MRNGKSEAMTCIIHDFNKWFFTESRRVRRTAQQSIHVRPRHDTAILPRRQDTHMSTCSIEQSHKQICSPLSPCARSIHFPPTRRSLGSRRPAKGYMTPRNKEGQPLAGIPGSKISLLHCEETMLAQKTSKNQVTLYKKALHEIPNTEYFDVTT